MRFVVLFIPSFSDRPAGALTTISSSSQTSPSPYCLQMNSLPQGVPLNICPSRIPLTSWMPCLVRASQYLLLRRMSLHCLARRENQERVSGRKDRSVPLGHLPPSITLWPSFIQPLLLPWLLPSDAELGHSSPAYRLFLVLS